MSKNDATLLNAVIKTLDTVQVQGRENMQKIMSCMAVIDKIVSGDTSGIIIEEESK